jgi:hypothetical protein
MNNYNLPSTNRKRSLGKHPRGSFRESDLVRLPTRAISISEVSSTIMQHANPSSVVNVKSVFLEKRRVRFDEDSSTFQVKRRVIEVESARSMTLEEKSELWYQRSEEWKRRASMASAVTGCQDDNVNFTIYAETLAETYLACCVDHDDDTSVTDTGNGSSGTGTGNSALHLDPERVLVLSMNHGDARGLEAHTLPLVTEDRVRRRLENVDNVIRLHQGLKLMDCQASSMIVGDYSAALSITSRRFARAMGAADATAALFEHASSLSHDLK